MKFYDCQPAPSPRLVRIFIAEKGLEIPTEQVDLRGGQHMTPAFRAMNPHCTVPVLETDEGAHLTSTQACWRYLEEVAPEPPLLGRSPLEKAQIADLVWHLEQDGLQAVAEGLRNSTPGMKGRALTGPVSYEQIPELAERGKLRARRFLEGFEDLLGTGPYLAGETFTAADIMALVIVDFARWQKIVLPEGAAKAQAWYAAVSERPSAKL